jgi:formate dehydrogenase major subunit
MFVQRTHHTTLDMAILKRLPLLGRWPVLRQLLDGDRKALGPAATSERSEHLHARVKDADRVVKSVCPYCGVGCGQDVYVKDEKIVAIEGDYDSPISEGTLCPKGSASFQLVTGNHRVRDVLYRAPHSREWKKIPLEQAMDMVAERVKKARDENWDERDPRPEKKQENGEQPLLRRTLAVAHLGGATLDNEENYLIKKLYTALGIVQVENQARI